MKIEIRNDSVLIDGYVNAVERESKILRNENGSFVEKIVAGAFQRALDRAKRTGYNIKVLLNHDYNRELTNTSEPTTNIREDAIGLRCTCEIRDSEVVQKAKDGKLVGWSFGFIPISQFKVEKEIPHREIRDMELKEVSILDNSKIPAYNGTSIETRSECEDFIELRMTNDEVEVVDKSVEKENPDLFEFKKRYINTRTI